MGMTIEEAHRILTNGLVNAPSEYEWCIAFEMAIKALETIPKYKDAYGKGWDNGAKASYEHLKMCEEEQRQSGDLISRQVVKEQMIMYGFHAPDMTVTEFVEDLPSVNPQEPKIGHWKSYTHNAYHGIDDYGEPIWREVIVHHCNLCNRRTVIKENYCPNCGAKMIKGSDTE